MRHLFVFVCLGILLSFRCLSAQTTEVMVVNINRVVHPITLEIVSNAIDQAERTGAVAILIKLNTPGGLAETTRQLTEKIVASRLPVLTYVSPSGGRAASAGFFLLEAGDVAAMAPGTNTGAATPVNLTGGEMDETMRRKVMSDAAAALRSVVERRGRNAKLAETTVLEARSFTEQEALKEKLIDLVALNEQELFQRVDGREIIRFDGKKEVLRLGTPAVVEYEPSLRERILSTIADPNLALILLLLGALGIYVEFTSPGLIVPGVLGAIFALLGLSALAVLPINMLGVALMLLALVLFVLEAYVTSGGILAGGGAIAMVLGALLLIDSPMPEMQIRLPTAIGLALPFAIVSAFLVTLVVRARSAKVATGEEGMIGEVGVAYTALKPRGKIFVRGEYWDAVCSVPVEPGASVRVASLHGLTLKVEPVSDKPGG